MKHLVLKYNQAAERTNEGWEQYSLPIGNGYAGASIFGGADIERLQFTTNTFANVYKQGGVSNFAEIHLHFTQAEISDYERGLRLCDGVAYSHYLTNGVFVNREAFFSYPDRVFAYRITAKAPMDFCAELIIPYLGARPVSEGGRTGEVFVDGTQLVMRGTLPSRELLYEGRLSIVSNGRVCVEDGKLLVKNATESVVYFAMGTSYKLCEEVFLEGGHKALGEDPHNAVCADLQNALLLGYQQLYRRHCADYTGLASRVELDLGGVEDARPTDELLNAYRNGEKSQYLEEVYYAYGRHLLISSSRAGTPPASLQGVWTVHDKSPWGSGFWHNINVQMNYWPAFTTNLAETFEAYVAYWKGYFKQAQKNATAWIADTNPENYVEEEGACGWFLGTGAFCYEIEGKSQSPHSGPGTGGLTSLMLWDYYDFTRDEKVLKDVAFPGVHSMAKFLTKTVRDYDGQLLCSLSASPEQILSGDVWIQQHAQQKYYVTVGCAFDQQMLYENAFADLRLAEAMGVEDEITCLERAQIGSYFPVQIGYSGQIKEFGEESFYGEIGEAKHRHLSQLMSLMPGSLVSQKTPAWLDAAKLTLTYRGDESTGWALAQRFCAWARACDGNHAYHLLNNLLQKRTHPNLWDVHPPFQIDGNFGAVAGMTEMLLQSHGDCIALFPALPQAWQKVSFKGLKARGNFTVSASYHAGEIEYCHIQATVGGRLHLRTCAKDCLTVVKESDGSNVSLQKTDEGVCWETIRGERYSVQGFAKRQPATIPEKAVAAWTESGVKLVWTACAHRYAVYRAVGDEAEYTLLGETTKTEFIDPQYTLSNKARATYKIVAEENHSQLSMGALAVVHPASRLQEERYQYLFKQLNLNA